MPAWKHRMDRSIKRDPDAVCPRSWSVPEVTISRPRRLFWVAVIGAALMVVVLAMRISFTSATTTQPQCVAHVKGGEKDRPRGAFSAASHHVDRVAQIQGDDDDDHSSRRAAATGGQSL